MTTCPLCLRPFTPDTTSNHRPWIIPGMLYGILFEHDCGTTRSNIIWEIDDEVLLQDDLASPLNHDRDTRECECLEVA